MDLASVPATGPDGTVTREDVERQAAGRPRSGPDAGSGVVLTSGGTAVLGELGEH
ncbi:MAG: E3 binding domain-containing protein, partial [Actinomycetes bacterium]